MDSIKSSSGLTTIGLSKTYKMRPVVRDVNITIKRGEAVGLLGPNGAGKTTTFSMIAGLVSPDNGTIFLDGHEITHLPMYRRARLGIGYLPQEPSVFRGMSVEENIMAVLELHYEDRDERQDILDALLSEFSIAHLRRSNSVTLSGGERRRLEIARTLAGDPHFILLDEPLAGIDPIAVHDIRQLIGHLKDKNIGVLITDHNVRETLDIVDRAYIIVEGSVLMGGSPSDIIQDRNVRKAYLGDSFKM
jgi:lipopolysaccharide export system ATP-binding protein